MPVIKLRLDTFPIVIPEHFNPPRRMRRPKKPGQPSPGPCPGVVAPFRPQFGGGFNARRGTGLHRAVDLMAGEGALIVAPFAGVVPHRVWITTGGKRVRVPGLGKTPKGGHTAWLYDFARGFLLYFAHALEPFRLELGQDVRIGTIIGLVGRSGNATASDGYGCPHLHFAARRCRLEEESGGPGAGSLVLTAQLGTAVDPGPELRRLYRRA